MTEKGSNKTTRSDEFKRLAFLRNIFSKQSFNCDGKRLLCGVENQDDAAVIEVSDEECLIITTDFVRGSGFFLFGMGLLNYFDVGYYLLVANISDVAAMGARACCATNVLRYSNSMTDDEFFQVFEGIRSAADHYGVTIIGGDIGGHDVDVFSACAFGFMKTRDILFRGNAHVGDLVCVTGKIGLPITALLYFKTAKPQGFVLSSSEEDNILNSWKRPQARVNQGVLLSTQGLASACQDISDGLKMTILQVSAASRKGIRIYEEKLPIDQATAKLAAFQGITPAQIAMSASVDFELLFTMSPDQADECTRAFSERGLGYVTIGEVTEQEENVLVHANGHVDPLPGIGWKQQVGDEYIRAIGSGERG